MLLETGMNAKSLIRFYVDEVEVILVVRVEDGVTCLVEVVVVHASVV